MAARRRVRRGTQSEPGSKVVGAAQVIAATGAHELAMVPGEPLAAVGADLAMVIDLSAGLRAHSTM
jgi:hypothetical protein